MKVSMFTKEDKQYITVAQWETAREIVKDMKEDDATPAWYMEIVAKAVPDFYPEEVIKADAKMATWAGVLNAYSDHSGNLDIMLTGLVAGDRTGRRVYVEISTYLSEVWKIDGEYRPYMIVTVFTAQ